MTIIDGNKIAKEIRHAITKEVKKCSRPPGLAVILVGDDPASEIYVKINHVHVSRSDSTLTSSISLPI